MTKSRYLAFAVLGGQLLLQDPAFAMDKTSIMGTFDGCDYDKTYDLIDGRTLTCRTYHYHYAYAPEVIILDSSTVLIDREEYDASVD